MTNAEAIACLGAMSVYLPEPLAGQTLEIARILGLRPDQMEDKTMRELFDAVKGRFQACVFVGCNGNDMVRFHAGPVATCIGLSRCSEATLIQHVYATSQDPL